IENQQLTVGFGWLWEALWPSADSKRRHVGISQQGRCFPGAGGRLRWRLKGFLHLSRAALGLLVIIWVRHRQDVVEVGQRWPRGFRPGALEGKDAGILSLESFP